MPEEPEERAVLPLVLALAAMPANALDDVPDEEIDVEALIESLGDIDAALAAESQNERALLAARLVLAAARAFRSAGVDGKEGDLAPYVSAVVIRVGEMVVRRQRRRSAALSVETEDDLDLDDLAVLPADLRRNADEGADRDRILSTASGILAEYAAVIVDDLSENRGTFEALLRAQAFIDGVADLLIEFPLQASIVGDYVANDPGHALFHMISMADHRPGDEYLLPAGVDPERWRWSRIVLCAEALATMPLGKQAAGDADAFRQKVLASAGSRLASAGILDDPGLFEGEAAQRTVMRSALAVGTRWLSLAVAATTDARDLRTEDDIGDLREIAIIGIVATAQVTAASGER